MKRRGRPYSHKEQLRKEVDKHMGLTITRQAGCKCIITEADLVRLARFHAVFRKMQEALKQGSATYRCFRGGLDWVSLDDAALEAMFEAHSAAEELCLSKK